MGCAVQHTQPARSALRRKWRVLVPILHLWSSLGKEAPLHLLLFAVADVTSFPGQSVRVSCHSVKILLRYREGFAEGKGGEVYVNQSSLFANEGACRRRIFSCPETFFEQVSEHFAFACPLMPNPECTEACPTAVPLLVSRLTTFLFRLAKEEKVQTTVTPYSVLFLPFLFKVWIVYV